ncbi:MAG: hypothetical protein AAFR09_09880, partial [Pseudomonadota bacterium]
RVAANLVRIERQRTEAGCDPRDETLVYQEAAASDKTIKMWSGLKHEIFNEPEQLEVLTEMTEWLDARH